MLAVPKVDDWKVEHWRGSVYYMIQLLEAPNEFPTKPFISINGDDVFTVVSVGNGLQEFPEDDLVPYLVGRMDESAETEGRVDVVQTAEDALLTGLEFPEPIAIL